MSKGATRLSLGPLPTSSSVKLTISLTADLKTQLDAYAQVHARVHHVPVDAAVQVSHMLAAFIARDRGFKALAFKATKSGRLGGGPVVS
ncbi:MAG TPA: DUF2274 domain-containing protein [Hyphomicrobiaceae bacterium]|nr:DUF2274 domain-containing protein [Hyphomicrobiaceae bacterium]